MYFPSAFCKESCDPNFTDLSWPCRGTTHTCTLANTKADGSPTDQSCWRYSFRHHQRICRESGGFMLQVEEADGLGKGQQIETSMADLERLKIFRVKQGIYAHGDTTWGIDQYDPRSFDYKDADQISHAIQSWLHGCRSNMKMETIELR